MLFGGLNQSTLPTWGYTKVKFSDSWTQNPSIDNWCALLFFLLNLWRLRPFFSGLVDSECMHFVSIMYVFLGFLSLPLFLGLIWLVLLLLTYVFSLPWSCGCICCRIQTADVCDMLECWEKNKDWDCSWTVLHFVWFCSLLLSFQFNSNPGLRITSLQLWICSAYSMLRIWDPLFLLGIMCFITFLASSW